MDRQGLLPKPRLMNGSTWFGTLGEGTYPGEATEGLSG